MFGKTSVTLVMTAEQRRKYHSKLKEVGPFQIEKGRNGISGDLVHVLLPEVDTSIERTFQISVIRNIESSIEKDKFLEKQKKEQSFKREIQNNLKKFSRISQKHLVCSR